LLFAFLPLSTLSPSALASCKFCEANFRTEFTSFVTRINQRSESIVPNVMSSINETISAPIDEIDTLQLLLSEETGTVVLTVSLKVDGIEMPVFSILILVKDAEEPVASVEAELKFWFRKVHRILER
jgi:hypothetical protein